MIYPPPGTQQISPLDFILLDEAPRDSFSNLLATRGGYFIRETTLKTFFAALKANRPLLIEGPPGGGKTTFPEALAKSFGLPLAYVQGMKDITLSNILFKWDSAAQNEYVRQAISIGGISFSEARQNQWTREFLDLGEVAAGYDYTARTNIPCVIILDEIDKVNFEVQSMLLQCLDRKYIIVPGLKPSPIVGIQNPLGASPIVFLTSNNQAPGIIDPLRSRAYYHYLEPPTMREVIRILQIQVPAATSDQIRQTAKLLKAFHLRRGEIKRPPQIREILAFLDEIVRNDISKISAQVLMDFSCSIIKTEKDTRSLFLASHSLANACQIPDKEVDPALDEVKPAKKLHPVAA